VSTWFIALVWRFPALHDLVSRNHADAGFLLLLATIFAGMVFEDFGARWEVQLDRWADARTDNGHGRNWRTYLQAAFKSDPIGRRYARTLVLRLKFELGIAFATISAGLGLSWLMVLGLGFSAAVWLGLFCLSFTAWGLVEAKETHKVLSKTRAALLENINVIE
jgi:hypothetical protein